MIAAGKEEIREWFQNGVKNKHKYMLIVYDQMDAPDESDSAYYADDKDEARRLVGTFNDDPMCKIMEIYDLTMDMETQLAEKRVWNLPD